MLIEENTKFLREYQAGFIYEWNFDGLTEHQIFNAIQQMAIAATTYRNKSEIIIARAIVHGFIGKLKGW